MKRHNQDLLNMTLSKAFHRLVEPLNVFGPCEVTFKARFMKETLPGLPS